MDVLPDHPSTSLSGDRRPTKHASPYAIDLQPIPVEKLVKCKMQYVFFSLVAIAYSLAYTLTCC